MLKYNKYLKEIGIKETDFPFRIEDNRYIEDEETHISEAETWNLDCTLNMIIYSYLRSFKENVGAYPGCLKSAEEWDAILDAIIEGFAIAITEEYPSNRKKKKIKKAKRLLFQWWGGLWW